MLRTHVPTCQFCKPFHVAFLTLSKPWNLLCVAQITYQGHLEHCHPMPFYLEGRLFKQFNGQQESRGASFLTHILDKTVDNLKNLHCGSPDLVMSESI